MKKRQFANTNIQLSSIGLGCMGMSHAYGDRNDEESLKTLAYAYEQGINFFDTADVYGFGDNEKLLSVFIKKHNREDLFIATKIGFKRKGNVLGKSVSAQTEVCGKPSYIRQAVEASLERLDTPYIDLLYLHRVDPNVPVEESVKVMAEFVKMGKVKFLGLSECTLEDLKKAESVWPISAIQSEYSFLTRQVETNGILDYCREMGIAFIPFSPLSRGLIVKNKDINKLNSNDFRQGLPRFHGEHLKNNLMLAEAFGAFAKKKGCTPAQLAISWVLHHGEFIIPISGTKHVKYLEDNIGAVDVSLTDDDMKVLDELLVKYPDIGERYGSNEKKFLKH